MTEREFWQLVNEIFGRTLGSSIVHDLKLSALRNMSALEALRSGIEPRVVWNILCDHMDVDDAHRWGKDHTAPPLPAVK